MESLRAALDKRALAYHWAGRQLGGRRRSRPGSPHTALPEGLRGFADHMDTAAFQVGATRLLALAARAPSVVLCAERLPDHCHRSLIADYLTLQGTRVIHLIASGQSLEHRLGPGVRRESVRLVYDRCSQDRLGQDF
jgi:uncharacterized protein (DUF488 family)